MSHRKQQVESTLKRALAGLLVQGLADPRVRGLVSVTRVEASSDFRNATVYVSVLPEKYEKRTLAALAHAAGHIHGLLRKAVAMRTVPHLNFRLDAGLKRESQVLQDISRATPAEPSEDES